MHLTSRLPAGGWWPVISQVLDSLLSMGQIQIEFCLLIGLAMAVSEVALPFKKIKISVLKNEDNNYILENML